MNGTRAPFLGAEQRLRTCRPDGIALRLVEAKALRARLGRTFRTTGEAQHLAEVEQRVRVMRDEVSALHEPDPLSGEAFRNLDPAEASLDLREHAAPDDLRNDVVGGGCARRSPAEVRGLVEAVERILSLGEHGVRRRQAGAIAHRLEPLRAGSHRRSGALRLPSEQQDESVVNDTATTE